MKNQATSRSERRRLQVFEENRVLRANLKQEQESNTRMKKEVEMAAQRDSGRLATVQNRDETIRLKDIKIAEVVAERDRLVRMVDQFTSLSIVPFGAALNHSGADNLPKHLRRT